jgi:hypothetical protein
MMIFQVLGKRVDLTKPLTNEDVFKIEKDIKGLKVHRYFCFT